MLLVVLAVATGTLVLAQHQSWRQSQLDQAAFAAGADVRVSLASPLPLGGGRARAGRARAPRCRSRPPTAASPSSPSTPRRQRAPCCCGRTCPACPWRGSGGGSRHRTAGPGLTLPGRPARLAIEAALRPPRGAASAARPGRPARRDGQPVRAGRLGCRLHGSRPGRCPPTAAPTSWWAPSARAGPAYPLRLLGLSLSYRLPGFPAPPGGGAAARAAALRAGQRRAAARATLAVRALAVSPRTSGGFPPPFAGAAALVSWHAAASSADLASPRAPGIAPAVTSWRPSGAEAALTFTVGAGHLAQRGGLAPLPVTGQLALTAGAPRLPIPVLATRAFLSSSGARLGEIVPLPVGNASVPVRLMAQVRAFPATGGTGPAVIIDQAWLQQALAAQSQPPLPVTPGGWAGGAAPRLGCPPGPPW